MGMLFVWRIWKRHWILERQDAWGQTMVALSGRSLAAAALVAGSFPAALAQSPPLESFRLSQLQLNNYTATRSVTESIRS